jgi:hypothetical protein
MSSTEVKAVYGKVNVGCFTDRSVLSETFLIANAQSGINSVHELARVRFLV